MARWHPFSSADVKYTVERIMNPPKGMVSPRGPVFAAIIERVEAPGYRGDSWQGIVWVAVTALC